MGVQDMKGVREILVQLAETGFVPLRNDSDPRAERLSLDNIAGTVSKAAKTTGIAPELWGNADFGLVPATQFSRLVIARVLNRM